MRHKFRRIASLQSLTLLLVISCYAGTAQAHVLKQNNGVAAVLHIPPEDNPKAAQLTQLELTFYSQQPAFSLVNCDCQVAITHNDDTIMRTPLRVTDAAGVDAVASVRFPAIGVYDAIVSGRAKDGHFSSFSLDYLVRVSESVDSPTSAATSGSGVVIIGAGSLIILAMIGYTAISRGGRYAKPAKTAIVKTRSKSNVPKV